MEKGFDLIEAALDSSNNADSGCEPVFLLLSTQQPSGSTVSYLNTQNEEYGVRLFTYGLGSATDPEVRRVLFTHTIRLHSILVSLLISLSPGFIWVVGPCTI